MMALSTETTAFVLVPGSFSPASFYHKVTSLLQGKGYAVHETDLKSVNDGTGAPVTMSEDAEHINSVITRLADQGQDVVLVMNSYSGIPGTESVKGLSKSEREVANKKGALVALVYLSSFVAPIGSSINKLMEGRMPEATQAPTDYLKLDPAKDGEYVFSHLDAADKKHYALQLKQHSSITFDNELTYAGYMAVPATYLICTDDLIIPPQYAHQMIDAAIEQGAKITKKEINSDHCPMISHPEEVVDVLLEAAA